MRIRDHIVWFCLLVLFCCLFTAASSSALEETGGIGMTVAQLYDETATDQRGYIIVLDVFEDAPADTGGVKRGDIITHINGLMTKGRDLDDILKNDIRGAEGATVFLRIWRHSIKKRIELEITRVPMIY